MKNSKGIETWNRLLTISLLLAAPYSYFFLMRPKLKRIEERLDQKVTEIDPKTLEIIKDKQDALKKGNTETKI